jgi:hypothetical protein
VKKKKFARVINSPLFVPLTLLVISILAYGLLIPSLGYYWDDWPYAWINHTFGPDGYPDFVASDRPYSAWIFMGLAALFGEQPLGYHISSLLLYWICGVLFWWLFRLIWSAREQEALWAALFFTIYPGFLEHPQAIIYNHHLIAMALYLFSMIGMVKAIQSEKQGNKRIKSLYWHLPAVIALGISQFTIEYYFGWEMLRPLIAWFVLNKDDRTTKLRVKQYLWYLVPFWLVSIVFLVWRVFFFGFPTYQPVTISQTGFVFNEFISTVLTQISDAVILAWQYAVPRLFDDTFSLPFKVGYLLIVLITSGFVYVILKFKTEKIDTDLRGGNSSEAKTGIQFLAVALVGIISAGWPFWLSGLTLDIDRQFNSRFTLAFIPWIAVLMTSLFYYISKIDRKWVGSLVVGLIAIIIGGSTGWHVWNANTYRNNWLEVQNYFQQLVARMPGIETGTALVINDMNSLSLYQDDSLTAILNWTYAPDLDSTQIPYSMQYLSVRLGDEIPALEPGLHIEQDYRSMKFFGSTDRVIVVYYQQGGCVRVLDVGDQLRLPLGYPEYMREVLALSDLSLIQTDTNIQAAPPLHLFDQQVGNDWCMVFQRADLAAQEGDWAGVVSLGDQAYESSLWANELSEVMVFVEGYLREGRIGTALEITQKLSVESEGLLDDELCTLWQQVENDLNANFPPDILDFCNSQ